MEFLKTLPHAYFSHDLLISAGYVLSAILLGLIVHAMLFKILGRLSGHTGIFGDEALLRYARKPSRLIFPLLFINLVVPSLRLPPSAMGLFHHSMSLLFIASISFLLINGISFLRDMVLKRHDIGAGDNLLARKVYTQIGVLEKVLLVVVIIASAAFMLMTFESIRQIGVSILASAGIAGIIIGLAAQKSISTLLAGIQIAITQPIRMDDVVIVEGEWGRIEEITLTYVVVRIWDLRRLVVPITYFIETPFQNWTRVSADILGTVFLYTDYTVPVEEIRQELLKQVKTTDLWDGKVCGLQVTDSKPETLELRLLVSAKDASQAWDLRCLLRERMIAFIQREYPAALPRVRAELHSQSDSPTAGRAKDSESDQ